MHYLCERYLRALEERGVAAGTYKQAGTLLQIYSRWLVSTEKTPEQLTYDDILEFRSWFLGTGLSASYWNTCICRLKGFYRYLLATARVSYVPISRELTITVPRRTMPIVRREEVHAILTEAQKDGPVWIIIVALMASAGLRAQEVANLRNEDLILMPDGPHLRIRGKGRKERIVVIPEELGKSIKEFVKGRLDPAKHNPHAAMLIQYHHLSWARNKPELLPAHPRARIIPHPIKYNTIHTQVVKYAHAAGVPHITPHRLRSYYTTKAVLSGQPLGVVQLQLGHETPDTTMRYVHAAPEALSGLRDVAEVNLPTEVHDALPDRDRRDSLSEASGTG